MLSRRALPPAGGSCTRGFTMVEMMLVLVTMSLLSSIVLQPARRAWVAASRRAATRAVTGYLFRARAIAVQQSRTAWLVRSGNVLKILVDSSGTPVQLDAQLDFARRYSATLGASPRDSVQFDPRGFALNLTASPRFTVTREDRSDTVCVTGLGRITTRSCP